MKLNLELTGAEAAQTEAPELVQRASLAALARAGGKMPPRGGEIEIVGQMAERSTQRYTAMLESLMTDLVKHT